MHIGKHVYVYIAYMYAYYNIYIYISPVSAMGPLIHSKTRAILINMTQKKMTAPCSTTCGK